MGKFQTAARNASQKFLHKLQITKPKERYHVDAKKDAKVTQSHRNRSKDTVLSTNFIKRLKQKHKDMKMKKLFQKNPDVVDAIQADLSTSLGKLNISGLSNMSDISLHVIDSCGEFPIINKDDTLVEYILNKDAPLGNENKNKVNNETKSKDCMKKNEHAKKIGTTECQNGQKRNVTVPALNNEKSNTQATDIKKLPLGEITNKKKLDKQVINNIVKTNELCKYNNSKETYTGKYYSGTQQTTYKKDTNRYCFDSEKDKYTKDWRNSDRKVAVEEKENIDDKSLLDKDLTDLEKLRASLQIELAVETKQKLRQSYVPEPDMNESIEQYGSNFYVPKRATKKKNKLRPIYIDGSNVAFRYTNGQYFSVTGLKICIDYFLKRGHEVRAFVPHFRKYNCSNPILFDKLVKNGLIITTPSRFVNGKSANSYDDRYVVKCAAVNKGIIVSCDNFKDLIRENPSLQPVIEQRLLMPVWVSDMLIFPDDPLGRNGPTLEEFLRF